MSRIPRSSAAIRRRDPRYRGAVSTDLRQLPVPAALLFDLDGTLVDTVETRIASWIEALAVAGFPTTRDRIAPLIGMDGRRLAGEIALLGGTRLGDEDAESIDHAAGEIYAELNRAPRALPGVAELVAVLDAQGIAWTIATSSRQAQVAASVAALDLAIEPRIVDASHVANAKPEPDLLLHAAGQLDLAPGRCWYVGDSTWDMLAAVAAGMIGVGVTAGAAVDAATLRRAGATATVPGLGAIADALRQAPTGSPSRPASG
jgi:HAD superfamily hydrolase (TIGR01509 family)